MNIGHVEKIKQIQTELNRIGFRADIDGIMGPDTLGKILTALSAMPTIEKKEPEVQLRKLCWGAKVSDDFKKRVIQIADKLLMPKEGADWLMACMAFESGRTFSANVRNKLSGACVDLATEILTLEGWKKHNEVHIGDDIWSLDILTKRMIIDKVVDKTEFAADDVWESTCRSFNAVSTGNHKWVLRHVQYNEGSNYGTETFVIKTTKDLVELASSTRYSIPHNVDDINYPIAFIVDKLVIDNDHQALMVLLGLIAGDGSLTPGHYLQLDAHLNGNSGEVALIDECNTIIGVEPSKILNSTGGVRWKYPASFRNEIAEYFETTTSGDKKAVVKTFTKKFITTITPEDARYIIKGYMHSDGHYGMHSGVRHFQFRNTENAIINDFMHIAYLAGLNPRLSQSEYFSQDGLGKRRKPVKTVRLRVSRGTSCNNVQLKHRKIEGLVDVWCPTTKTGTWVARRNGTVYITHNCGLIQFMPTTAGLLGTTTQELAGMTPLRQLDYVEKYLAPYKGRITNIDDLYMTILWPAAVGKPDAYPLWVNELRHPKAYIQNAGLDRNKDGIVEKREAASKVRDIHKEGLEDRNYG